MRSLTADTDAPTGTLVTTGLLRGPASRVVRSLIARMRGHRTKPGGDTRFPVLAGHVSDAILCLDLDLRRTYLSPAYFTLLGHDPGETIAGAWDARIHPEDRAPAFDRLLHLARGISDREKATYRIRHQDGRWIWVEAVCGLVRDRRSGSPASIVCVLRDVSEWVARAEGLRNANMELERVARDSAKAHHAARQAGAANSRFLATISHELRTPLNGVIGYAEMLMMEGGLTPAQVSLLEKLQGAGHHLAEMLNGVLDPPETEADRALIAAPTADLPKLAAACLDLVRLAAEDKGLTASLAVAPGAPREITVDAARLRQVLLDLLGDAVKFAVTGSVVLHIGPATDPGFARIEVRDTRQESSAEQRRRLLQASDLAGADLPVPMRTVARMGGRAGHARNHPCGNVVWLELPLGPHPAPPPPAAAVRPLRILLVDDVLMNREIAAAYLRSAGHAVVLAEGGAEAVAAAGSADFDLVLMDVRMPEVDGLEATRRVRALSGDRGRVPIVALTAQAFAEQVAECRLAGMNAHLAKPYTRDSLLQAVAAACPPERPRTRDAEPRAPASPAAAPDASLIDLAAFDRTAAHLPPASVISYLKSIEEQAVALMTGLGAPGRTDMAGDLAEAAHKLAGSAGLFGLVRLSLAAREFEHAARTDSPQAPARAASLTVALEGSLDEIRRRLPVMSAE